MADTNKVSTGSSKFNFAKFFRETKSELKKVTWPSKEQLIHNTGIIISFIIIVCIILSLLDFGFNELIKFLIP